MRGALLLLFLAAGGCVSSSGGVPVYECGAPREGSGKFVVFGDSRRTLGLEFWRRDYPRERLLVIEALAAEDPAFIVNTGDLVSVGSDAAEWRAFHADNRPIFAKGIPYYPGLGNHEYASDPAQGLANYFAFFPHLKGRKWYEVRFPPVLVAVLDSNFGRLGEEEAREQDRWLAGLLAAAEGDAAIRHVILCCHHAPYTNSDVHPDSKQVQARFAARRTPKVKALVSGHVHSYERFLKEGVQYVVSGGGGAPLTSVDTDRPKHRDEFRGGAYRGFHYLRFTLEGGRLRCDVVMLQDGGTWKRVDGFECP